MSRFPEHKPFLSPLTRTAPNTFEAAVQDKVIDHVIIRPVMAIGQRIALGAQLGDDPLGIDQRLRAAERDEADGRG